MTGAGSGQRFRPEDRIRRKADFDRAYASGQRVPSKSFTLIVSPAGCERARLGVTISKKVGSAVVRNAVRRRIREAFRRNRSVLGAGIDIIVHVRAEAAGAGFRQLESELLEALGRYGSLSKRKRR